MFGRKDPDAIHALMKALSDPHPSVRETATEGLGETGARVGAKALLAALQDRAPNVRWQAATSLGRVLHRKAPAQLIRALSDPNELVRVEVAEAIGHIGDPRGLPALRRALTDRSWLVRSYVAESIGRFGRNSDIILLRRAVKREVMERARVGFHFGLYLLGHRPALRCLVGLVESRHHAARTAALGALELIAAQFSEPLVNAQFRRRLRRLRWRVNKRVVRHPTRRRGSGRSSMTAAPWRASRRRAR